MKALQQIEEIEIVEALALYLKKKKLAMIGPVKFSRDAGTEAYSATVETQPIEPTPRKAKAS